MNNKKRKRRPNAKAIKRLKIMLICSICAVVLCLIVCIILIIKGAGDEKPDDKKASDTINIVIPDSTAAYTAPSVTDSSAEPAVTLPPVTLPPAADTTVQTEEPADSKSENENKAHVIFVGDSRYDGMVSYKEETDEFFCKVCGIAPGDDVVPFCIFSGLSAAISVSLSGSKCERGYFAAGATSGISIKVTYIRVSSNVTDKHYFIQTHISII